MADYHEMRRCDDGQIRPVYTDSEDREYVVIGGHRYYAGEWCREIDDVPLTDADA